MILKSLKQLTSSQCKLKQHFSVVSEILSSRTIYSFFALLLVVSTIYDVVMRHKQVEPNKLLIAFSVYTNGQKLFDVRDSSSPNSINCLHGLRALSVMWIIFGHRFTTQKGFPLTNPNVLQENYAHLYSAFLTAFNLAVDTFFVMGALLLTTSILNSLDKKKLNIPKMILHRYLRYTPVFAALILYTVSLSKFTINGPIKVPELRDQCIQFWWTALLHVQNYVNPNTPCSGHAWYLSADFQLFVISPFLIYPAWKYGWKYLWSMPVLAVMSSIYVLIICFTRDIRVFISSQEMGEAFSRLIYNPTHARMGPWLVGIMLGYILYTYKDKTIRISKRLNAFLWILSLSVLTVVVCLVQPLRLPGNATSLASNAFYIAFHRLAWTIAVCWIIFACQKLKTGGIIRWFLSLAQWQPIGRMSLSMYLAHPFYQLSTSINTKDPFTFEIMPMVREQLE